MASALCILFVLLTFWDGLGAVKVQIFKDRRYKGLIYDHDWNGQDCHNVKSYAQGMTGSVLTDACLVVYDTSDCAGNSFKLSPDDTEGMEVVGRVIRSYHMCNDMIGGQIIRVDMFDPSNALIARYHDICGCQDLPSQVSTKVKRLDNYGNCITAHSTDTCGGDHAEIAAGRNENQDLSELGFFIRSISACGERPACIKLHSEIQKFEVLPDQSRAAPKPKEVALATKTTVYNNGSATVLQEYEARKKVIQAVTLEKSSTISKMTSRSESSGWNVGASLGLEDKASGASITGRVAVALKSAYGSSETEESSNSSSVTHAEEKEFAARQIIEVPPCVEYEVQGVLETLDEYPLIYEVYTKVSGDSSGRKMTADEIMGQVSGMDFVETTDEYGAIFKSTHSLTVSVGVETKISGEGKIIPGCLKKLKSKRQAKI